MSALDDVLDPERWDDDSYGDQCAGGIHGDTLDAAREELRALRAELVELREAYDEVAAKRLTLHAENAAMREALEFYAQRTPGYENRRIEDGDVDRWPVGDECPYYNCASRDGGKIARTALGGRDA